MGDEGCGWERDQLERWEPGGVERWGRARGEGCERAMGEAKRAMGEQWERRMGGRARGSYGMREGCASESDGRATGEKCKWEGQEWGTTTGRIESDASSRHVLRILMPDLTPDLAPCTVRVP